MKFTDDDRLKLFNGILCELGLNGEFMGKLRKNVSLINLNDVYGNKLSSSFYYNDKDNAFVMKPSEDILLIAGNERKDDSERFNAKLFMNNLEVIKGVVGRRLRLAEEYDVIIKDDSASINISYKNLVKGDSKTSLSFNLNKNSINILYNNEGKVFDLALYDKITNSDGKDIYKGFDGNNHYLKFICQEREYDRNIIFTVNNDGTYYLNGNRWARDPESYNNKNNLEYYDSVKDLLRNYVKLDEMITEINNVIPPDVLKVVSDFVYGDYENGTNLRGFISSIDKNKEYSRVK